MTGSTAPLVFEGRPSRQAWLAFGILFALMVVDYIDRQIVVSMFPHLKEQWALSDARLGGLVSVVAATVAVGTVPIALLADRWSRVKSIALMALVWSLATIACAFAGRYEELVIARGVVGLGEAAYGAVGAALLASLFPPRMRSTVLAAFLSASLVGSVLGVALGGVIAQRHGWQVAFGLAGIPGLLLALLFIAVVRDHTKPESSVDSARRSQTGTVKSVVAALLRPRTMRITCVAGGLQLFMVAAIYAWMPSLLHRNYAMPPDVAGMTAAVLVLCGGIGAVLCGVTADRLGRRIQAARLRVSAAAAALTALLMWMAFTVFPPGAAQLALMVAGATVMTGTIGPSAAVVVDVVPPALRGTAASILALTQNLFGLAAGPLVTGLLSDRYGLAFSLSIVPLFCVAAAYAFVMAARTYEADLRTAEAIGFSDDGRTEAVAA